MSDAERPPAFGILLVDHEPRGRAAFQQELAKYGFDVLGASDPGPGLVPLYRQLQPYLVIVDLSPPHSFAGIEAIRRLTEADAEVRILTHSTADSYTIIDDEKLLDASGYVSRVWDSDPLVTAVMRAL